MTAAPELILAGRIATLAGDAGPGWAEAIAVRDGRVVAAGRAGEVAALAGPRSRRLRLAPDEVALPGLTDAHLHLVSAALAREGADLTGSASVGEAMARVQGLAARRPAPGTWLTGGGWDPDALGRWPSAEDLEGAAPGRPVALWAHDHHALLASRAALRLAGIHDATPDPEGGVIRRDPSGRPTGVLHEAAASLVGRLVPVPGEAAVADAVEAMGRDLVALGVVAVHDPGGLAPEHGLGVAIGAYRALAASGRLPLRVHACIRAEQLDAAAEAGFRSGGPLGPDPLGRLRAGWLKLFADGTLGSRTAALLEPIDEAGGPLAPPAGPRGAWNTPPDRLAALAARAAGTGIAAQIHAIGDAAVRAALDALAPTVGATPLMPRVEHVQLVADADVSRFAALGIAASMQPVHVRSDAAAARLLWGARADGRAYAMASVARSGAVLAAGTDAPVEPADPWPGLECAVTRSAPGWPAGRTPLGPSQALGLWESVRSWCVGPAIAAGERDRGRLVPGQRADVAVLPAAALAEPVAVGGPLWHARPRLVLMDGRVAFEV